MRNRGIKVKVTIKEDKATVNFFGSDKEVQGSINSGRE